MERPPSCSDFCGDSRTLQEYQTDHQAVNWYACADCARLIGAEQWELLIERSLESYEQLRAVPDCEGPILRQHVQKLVQVFRSFRPVRA